MSIVDLYGELGAALDLLRQAPNERAWLRRQGIACGIAVGLETVRSGAVGYEPVPQGAKSFVFAALDRPHRCGDGHEPPRSPVGSVCALIDLAAWRPSEPGVIRLRRGNVYALGEWAIERDPIDGEPLRLHETPLAWHAHGCAGAVVIDWKAAAAELIRRPEIVCDTVELAQQLEAELKLARRRITPRMPQIGIVVTASGATA